MVIDERARRELYQAVEGALGREPADTLMSLLPPVGWADVATKHDLAALEERLDLRFEALDLRFEALEHKLVAAFRGEMVAQTRTLMLGLIGAVVSLAGLAMGALRLA